MTNIRIMLRTALIALVGTLGAEELRPAGWVLLPAIGSSPETGFQYGGYVMRQFAQTDTHDPQDRLELLLQGTTKGQFKAFVWPNFFVADGDWSLSGKLGGRYWPTTYFGQSNDVSLEEEGEVYALKTLESEAGASYRFTSELYIGALIFAEYEAIEDDADSGLLNDGVRGFSGGLYSGVGLDVAWSNQDDRDWPTQGSEIDAQIRQYSRYLGSEIDFTTLYSDAAHVIQISDDVLALGISYQFGNVGSPFTRLPQPSGSHSLRGANGNRWSGHHLLGTQTEYRMTVSPRWAVVGFLDTAQVADDLNQVTLDRFHTSLGAGVRFATMAGSRFNIRGDIGLVDMESVNFTISVGEAF